ETRVDLLLSLFERAVVRLRQAHEALTQQQPDLACELLVKAEILVQAIASGVNLDQGPLAQDLLRLYEFALFAIREATPEKVDAALQVLSSLHEAFRQIREEASELERKGLIPRAAETSAIEAIA